MDTARVCSLHGDGTLGPEFAGCIIRAVRKIFGFLSRMLILVILTNHLRDIRIQPVGKVKEGWSEQKKIDQSYNISIDVSETSMRKRES